jgi:hypothetical protein
MAADATLNRIRACEESNRQGYRAILCLWHHEHTTDFQRELARRGVARIGTQEDKIQLAALEEQS